MFQKFFVKVLNYKTNSALEHALQRFGKCSSRKIAVQSTSISRRKCKLGGRNRIEPGRPLKALNNNIEHHYAHAKSFKINLKKAALPQLLYFSKYSFRRMKVKIFGVYLIPKVIRCYC